jgi:hypothetical protein
MGIDPRQFFFQRFWAEAGCALLTAATTSRQWEKANSGNSAPVNSQTRFIIAASPSDS